MTDLREKVARAILRADDEAIPDGTADGLAEDISDWAAHLADAALRVVRDAMREPSTPMVDAALGSYGKWTINMIPHIGRAISAALFQFWREQGMEEEA